MREQTFEEYYVEVMSFLDNVILPQHLSNKIQEPLKEFVYTLYYRDTDDVKAAVIVTDFINTFRHYFK